MYMLFDDFGEPLRKVDAWQAKIWMANGGKAVKIKVKRIKKEKIDLSKLEQCLF